MFNKLQEKLNKLNECGDNTLELSDNSVPAETDVDEEIPEYQETDIEEIEKDFDPNLIYRTQVWVSDKINDDTIQSAKEDLKNKEKELTIIKETADTLVAENMILKDKEDNKEESISSFGKSIRTMKLVFEHGFKNISSSFLNLSTKYAKDSIALDKKLRTKIAAGYVPNDITVEYSDIDIKEILKYLDFKKIETYVDEIIPNVTDIHDMTNAVEKYNKSGWTPASMYSKIAGGLFNTSYDNMNRPNIISDIEKQFIPPKKEIEVNDNTVKNLLRKMSELSYHAKSISNMQLHKNMDIRLKALFNESEHLKSCNNNFYPVMNKYYKCRFAAFKEAQRVMVDICTSINRAMNEEAKQTKEIVVKYIGK